MSDRPEPLSPTIEFERERRPRWKYNAYTHEYWTLQIEAAREALDIDRRAAEARRNKEFETYDLQDKVNSVTRKLRVKAMSAITDTPIVTPRFREADDEERWFDALVALVRREMEANAIKQELREMIWDNYTADIAWAKVDFISQFSDGLLPAGAMADDQRAMSEMEHIRAENQNVLINGVPMVAMTDLHGLHIEQHEDFLDEMTVAVQSGQLPSEALTIMDAHIQEHRAALSRTVSEKVRFRRWPSYLVTYDPFARRWEDVEWYAIEFVERKERLALQDNPKLRHLKDLEGGAYLQDDLYREAKEGRKESEEAHLRSAPREKFIRYYVIHSKVDDQLIVIAQHEKSGQLPLFVGPWPYPVEIVRPYVLNKVNDRIHGVSEIKRIKRLHDEQAEVRRKISLYIENLAAAKGFVKRDKANNQQFKRQLNDPNVKWVACDDPNAVNVPKLPELDPHLLDYHERLDLEMNEEAGTPEFAQAAATDETATATAARDRMFGATVRDMKESLAEVVRWFCDCVIEIWRIKGTVEQMVRTVGDRGRMYIPIQPRAIPHGITWEVDPDSMAPANRDLEKKNALEYLQAVGPFIAPGSGLIDGRKVLAPIIRKFDGPEDIDEVFIGPPAMPLMNQALLSLTAGQPPTGPPGPEGGGAPPQQQPEALPPMQEPMTGNMTGAMNAAAAAV